MKQRRRKSDWDWKWFLLVAGTVALFSVAGFMWGFSFGVEFG